MNAARWFVAAGAMSVLLGAGSFAWIVAHRNPIGENPDDARLVARGKGLYAQHCAACHGADLEGQPNWRKPLPNGRLPAPPHDATGHTWHHGDKQLFEMIKNGTAMLIAGRQSDMPVYRDILGDDDIWAILRFIESTWPADIRARQKSIGERTQ